MQKKRSVIFCTITNYNTAYDQIEKAKHIILVGHSLGGAVAALFEPLLPLDKKVSTCLIGSPRYRKLSTIRNIAQQYSAIHIRRRGDLIPLAPPKLFSYVDIPDQFYIADRQIFSSTEEIRRQHIVKTAALFFGKCCQPHYIEHYRKELGKMINAPNCEKDLTPYDKLKEKDV